MRLARRVAAVLAAFLMVLQARPASADVRTDARREFRAGMAAVAAGKYDEGIAHLEQAYDILPHPNVLYNIALAHMYAGRPDAALYYFERYKESGTSSDMAEVDALMRSLQEANAAVAKQDGGGKPEATPATSAPQTASSGAVSGESVGAVERTAQELRKLAEASNSEALMRYAEELDKAAQNLRAQSGEEASAAAPAPAPTPPPRPVAPPVTREAQKGVYEEEVVSASRLAQSPLDAPNATSIITAQDIRMTGITNVAELMRRVAGIEVNSVTPNHAEVAIRGLNRRTSNKLLLLIDGRPMRLDFTGTNWFDQIPISLEDVERIEIIRGPASALYGADAFSGIVNIVTRAPGEGESFVFGGGGNMGQGRAVASFTGKRDDLAYHFGFGYKQAYNSVDVVGKNRADVEALTDDPDYSVKGAWANGEVRYNLGKKSVATVGGSINYGGFVLQGLSRQRQVSSVDAMRSMVYGSITTPVGIRLASFWDHLDGNSASSVITPGAIEVLGYGVQQDIADVDLSWSDTVKLLFPHTLTLGGGYRYKTITWVWLAGEHTQHHFGAYLQDVMQVTKTLRVQLGARVDRHPLLDSIQFSPRGSIIWRFLEDQSLRLSVGRAFRGPSFLESYVQLANSAPLRGVTAWGRGNTNLDPESITSYELGYQNQASDYFALELNGYFNMVKDAILFTDVRQYTLRDYANDNDDGLSQFQPDVDAFPISALRFTNERATFRQIGGELGLRFYPIKGLDVYSNYSVHDTRPFDKKDVDPVRAKEQQTSLHKVNAGLQYRARFGLDISTDVSWFSQQVWIEQVTDAQRGVRFETIDQPAIVVLNGRLGYRLFNDRVELGVVGTNLTFNDRRQHPFGQPMDTRVMGTTKVKF